MQDELKPCPFCGEHVTLVNRGELYVFACPDHSTCRGVGFATYAKADQLATAIVAWNTRVDAHPPTTNPVADRETPVGDHQMVEAVADAMREYQAANRTWRMEDLAQAALTAARAQVEGENQRLREALDNAATLLAKAVGDIVAYRMIANKRPDESAADEYVEGINAIDALLAAGEHRKDAP